MHSTPRKVLEMHLCSHECHLKQKVESEVDVYLKVLNFQPRGRLCHVGAAEECSVKVNKFSSFCRTGRKLEDKHN